MRQQLAFIDGRAGAIEDHQCLATRTDLALQRPARWPAAATRAPQLPPVAARVRQVPPALAHVPAAHWKPQQMSTQSFALVAAAAAAADSLLHALHHPLELGPHLWTDAMVRGRG